MWIRAVVARMIMGFAITTIPDLWATPYCVFWLELLAELTMMGIGKRAVGWSITRELFVMEMGYGVPVKPTGACVYYCCG